MSKKLIITPIAILLCITMFATLSLPATAQTTTNTNQPTTPTRNPGYAQSVYNYVNVGNPTYMLGSGPDGKFTQFHSQGKVICSMNTDINSGSYIGIYAKGNGQLTVYVSYGVPGNNPPHVVTHSINSPNGAWYYGIAPIKFNHISVTSETGNVDVDCVVSM
ncbi:MAG: hypothetical protein FWH37_00080 [Candidatus Bathyarchaeota archaeon]|nr:hypothetical protein [Candidatus Termiticorpusculum sp.]